MKYKLYIRQYDITTNDYKVREEIVETNDVYHEIGKIYSTAFTEIKRIDYEKIDETKELKKEIERLKNINEEHRILNGKLRVENSRLNNIINELEKWLEERLEKLDINGYDDDIFNGIELALYKLQELKGSEKE